MVQPKQTWVIHASANDFSGNGKVHKEKIELFLSGIRDFAVYRFTGNMEVGSEISNIALSQLEKPFDAKFDLLTFDRLYCSELVSFCVNTAAQDTVIEPSTFRGKRIVTVDDCYKSQRFVKVYDSRATRSLE